MGDRWDGELTVYLSGIFELLGLLLHDTIQRHPLTLGFNTTE
jgi:hypothetical protein